MAKFSLSSYLTPQEKRQGYDPVKKFEEQQAGVSNYLTDPKRWAKYIPGALTAQSQFFKQAMPSLAEKEFQGIAQQGQSNLRDLQRQIRQQAQRRGLLYSGIRSGQEAQAQGATAAELARARASINQGLLQEQKAMEQMPAQYSLKNFQSLLQQQANRQAQQQQEAALRQQGLSNIGQGIGYGFGTLSAKDGASPSTQNPYQLTSAKDSSRMSARNLFNLNYGDS